MATQQKLDPAAQHLLQSVGQPDAAEADATVAVLVRGQGSFSAEQLDALREAGATIRTVAGDILTADAALSALPRLAQQPFVIEVGLSQPLHQEAGRRPSRDFLDVE